MRLSQMPCGWRRAALNAPVPGPEVDCAGQQVEETWRRGVPVGVGIVGDVLGTGLGRRSDWVSVLHLSQQGRAGGRHRRHDTVGAPAGIRIRRPVVRSVAFRRALQLLSQRG